MPEKADRESYRARLASEARPVRRWLTRYFSRRVRNPADVEDMVQDVFARIAARDSDVPVEHLEGYVLKTASSVAADRARRRTSHGADLHVAYDADSHADEEIDPHRIYSGKEDLRAAMEALLSLPERTRTVFLLRRLEGFSYREVAERLGISVSAVEKHMLRAVRHLSIETEKRRDR